VHSEMSRSNEATLATGPRDRLFIGSAVARYDIDELDTLAKRPKQEKYVEVRRPDGSVAKSRGERTFYGAFTGGFSAGYWNTVGSKEGWSPATFSSSRSKRSQHVQRVEDFMDDEDLQEHQSSHKTITPRDEFMPKGAAARGLASAVPGGLPKELEQELFLSKDASLGSKLLQAAKPSEPDAAILALGPATASSSSTAPAEKREPVQPSRKRYGCALPEAGVLARPEPPTSVPVQAGSTVAEPDGFELKVQVRFRKDPTDMANAVSRAHEVRLEQLWRHKADRHGIGYGLGFTSAKGVPKSRRLYMSAKKARSSRLGEGYGDFGTGVFDMEDHDEWEDLYEADYSKQVDYDHMLKDADVEDEVLGTRFQGVATSAHAAAVARGEVPGFTEASEPDAVAEEANLSQWMAPMVPRTYRGVHRSDGNAAAEATHGSKEHRLLLEFLERHGPQRLSKPSLRAELLGEKVQAGRVASVDVTEAKLVGAEGVKKEALPVSTAVVVIPDEPSSEVAVAGQSESALAQPAPLWNASSQAVKDALLKSLGRNFVVGANQDMDGNLAKHQPFNSDPKKQQRYARFCLALEGKGSASEALQDDGGLAPAVREAELEEFGRVYRTFRQENPDAKLQDVLNISTEVPMPAVLRRQVASWAPERLLCKRFGVPPPTNFQGGELPCSQRQKAYQAQVKDGLAKLGNAGGSSSGDAKKAGWEPPTEVLQASSAGAALQDAAKPPVGDAPRPPKSLFSAIFGDGDIDEALEAPPG